MNEPDQKEIPIPDHVLENLRNQISTTESETDLEDGEIVSASTLTDEQFKMYVMVGKWLTETLDTRLKNAGGSGIGLPAENFAKLAVIAHEKELAAAFSQNPGKALFYGTLTPIILENGSKIYRAKKKESKKNNNGAAENE